MTYEERETYWVILCFLVLLASLAGLILVGITCLIIGKKQSNAKKRAAQASHVDPW
jgi:hypothetical protein